MANSLREEIAAKVSLLPPERLREALSLIEQLAARATPHVSTVPRTQRRLKGATAHVRPVSSEEIFESRCEMWGEYMREDET